MTTLQIELASRYPDAFQIDTWQELLPRFVDDQLVIHYARLSRFYDQWNRWQANPQLEAEPQPIPLSAELLEACELLAQQDQKTYQVLAMQYQVLQYDKLQLHKALEHAHRIIKHLHRHYHELVPDDLANRLN
ncbi:hypothetical protein DYU11_07210 [Fibrisoma montanum]|uniref:Uncharacterized protein n=1 Tax=Fibrisoma montanum TaxID=2305895 RepID=A0A418ME58_9BACT|nr:hypothetical protein [Fibrisoma montanum]RIV25100.1 hypothetical protein DYU11_07210 [Fibrisoma montanum]